MLFRSREESVEPGEVIDLVEVDHDVETGVGHGKNGRQVRVNQFVFEYST